MEVLNSPKPDFHSKMNTESPTSPARKLPMIPGRVKDGTCAPAFPFEKMAVSGSGVLSPKLPTSPFVPPNSTITNYQKLPLVLPDLPAAPSPRRIRKVTTPLLPKLVVLTLFIILSLCNVMSIFIFFLFDVIDYWPVCMQCVNIIVSAKFRCCVLI